MFERVNTPLELYNHQLRAALKMEQTVIGMLADNIEHVGASAVRGLLEEHQEQTREHVQNLEYAFTLLGWQPETAPSPAIDGIEKEAKANLKKTDQELVDLVILAGATETEHHEIAVYETLITLARAVSRDDTVTLLSTNPRQEQAAHQRVAALLAELAGKQARSWRQELVEIAPREDD
jgi:ferritin-like metal-binding protein YciE